jgi:hypothetical protein
VTPRMSAACRGLTSRVRPFVGVASLVVMGLGCAFDRSQGQSTEPVDAASSAIPGVSLVAEGERA